MNDEMKGNSIMGAAIFGAIAGATAVALLNKDMRKNLKQALVDSLEKGDQKMDELAQRAGEVKDDMAEKAVKKLSQTKKKMASTT